MQEKERLKQFDLLKVIAMVFVCISHVYQRVVPGATSTVIFGVFYSVHMALFMFVGGYFIKRCATIKDLFNYFLKMLAYYVYPALLFTILTVISMLRYANHDLFYWLNEFLVRTDTFYWYGISAIIINFLLSTAFFISNKILKTEGLKVEIIKNLLTLVIFAVFMLPFIFIFKSKNAGLLATNLTIEFAPPAVFGFLIRSFGVYVKKSKTTSVIEFTVWAVCLVCYVIALVNFKGWLDKGTTLKLALHQLGSLAGVYVYYVLAKWLCKTKIFSSLSLYGKYSYPLYLTHVYLIRVITPYVSKIAEINFYTVSFVIIYALVFTLGSIVITSALTKNKYVNLALFGDYKPFIKP